MMHAPAIDLLTEEEKGVLLALLYFDIFHYPLTQNEITKFSPYPLGKNWQKALEALVDRNCIYSNEGYYSLHNDAGLITRRVAGNQLSEKRMKTARRFSAIISRVPFVRSVMLSGSISKGYMDETSDIDYFIITKPGRLWMVRAAMAIFRRIFLFNSRKYLCTNYFIDNATLEISEKNFFTAIEASTLKPMVGNKYICEFQVANRWCAQFLPNYQPENGLGEERESRLKGLAERLLAGKFADALERWLMKKFISHFKGRYQHALNGKDYSIAFQSTVSVSRSHPEFYQKKVLAGYEHKVREFEQEHNLKLQP